MRITGREGNETDLTVHLHTLNNPSRETNFENCVSDVNIPLGEVFTSPVLEGTKGLLHVKEVYVREYLFKDLRLEFEDGRVTEFSCGNFDSGKELVKQVILNGHSWLPLGEFAIGTNTAAYAMAKIQHRQQASYPDRRKDRASLCSGRYLLQLCRGFTHVQS